MNNKTLAAVAVIALVLLPALPLGLINFWGPKFKSAERNVFEQSKSFNHGMKDDLAKYYGEYVQTEDADKKLAIKSIVRLRFADFDCQTIQEPALRIFLTESRGY